MKGATMFRIPSVVILGLALFAPLAASAADTPTQKTSAAGAQPEKSDESLKRMISSNNLKQLALGMEVFASAHKRFPAAAIRDANGKPLLSWRVEILPYIEQKDLYTQFRLDEPWDSEHNKALLAKMPAIFRGPYIDAGSTNAAYFVPTGKGMFAGDDQGKRFKDITDGTSRTIMLIEAKREIPWTKPEDIEIDPDSAKPLPTFGFPQAGGVFVVAFADGSVKKVADTIDPKLLRELLTVAGGEAIPPEAVSQAVIGREDPKPVGREPIPPR